MAYIIEGGTVRQVSVTELREWFANRADDNPVKWNPYNKVVQDHRDGTIDHERTNEERAKRKLRVPWKPNYGKQEVRWRPYF